MCACDAYILNTTKLPNCSFIIVYEAFKLNHLGPDILEAGRFKTNTRGIGYSGKLPLYPIVVILYSGRKWAVP